MCLHKHNPKTLRYVLQWTARQSGHFSCVHNVGIIMTENWLLHCFSIPFCKAVF